MRLSSIAFIAGLAFAALATQPARAQGLYDVSVTNYTRVPVGATFVTDMNENTELTSTAEGALRQALSQRGLDYDVNGTVGFKIGTQRETRSQNAQSAFDTSTSILVLNLNSGDVKGAPRIGNVYRITLNIYDRASGAVLARGDVTDTGINFDPVSVTPTMVEELLQKVEF